MPSRKKTLRSVTSPHSAFAADFDAAYDTLRAQIDADLTAASLVPLLMDCIRLAESIAKRSKDKGDAKKQLVLALMTRLIRDSSLPQSQKVFLQETLERIGPSIIDGLLDADHGKLLQSWWRKLTACCK